MAKNTPQPDSGYPRGWPQPAGAITYQLNGARVGRGNILNLSGSGITAVPSGDTMTYNISGGGSGGVAFGDPASGYTPSMVVYVDNTGNLYGDGGFVRDQSTLATTIDIGNTYFHAGDTNVVGNGTFLSVDDNTQTITGKANIVTFGDTDGTGNNSYVYLNDGGHTIDIYNDGLINFRNPSSGEDIVTIETSTKVIRMGDIASGGQDTVLTVNDSTGTTTSNAAIHHFGFNAQPNLLYLDYGNALYWIGAKGSGNGTSVEIKDGGTDRKVSVIVDYDFEVIDPTGNFKYLDINPQQGTYSIGDLNNDGNFTYIMIRDFAQTINISNVPAYADDAAAGVGGLVVGDIYKTTSGGSTFLKIVP